MVARFGGDLEDEPVVEMLTQHARIRGLAMQLGDEMEREGVRSEPCKLWESC